MRIYLFFKKYIFSAFLPSLYSGVVDTKIQERMSTKVFSSKNLHTPTPFRLFSILVPEYYNQGCDSSKANSLKSDPIGKIIEIPKYFFKENL